MEVAGIRTKVGAGIGVGEGEGVERGESGINITTTCSKHTSMCNQQSDRKKKWLYAFVRFWSIIAKTQSSNTTFPERF